MAMINEFLKAVFFSSSKEKCVFVLLSLLKRGKKGKVFFINKFYVVDLLFENFVIQSSQLALVIF